ncbi:MAG: large subunit ribosomal protein [Pyrinomonadaceae bacterium]|jgi:large subunit ribosomal protein L25|nr:large subunit ribosomal protein [Pyrinomonadaceae bacterium]MDQ1729408.1 large subunit ribosomal protein [Pyrinomonadaceae bacterium]
MAEHKDITVQGKKREGKGKNDARRERRGGMVPVSVYGGEGGSVAAVAPLKDLAAILRSESGRNTIFTLNIEGVGPSEVMFHDRQIDPVRGRLIHADLTRLVKGQKIEVTVPLHLEGEPVGVREEQGVLEQIIREIQIRCEPREIPDVINVDVSNLGVHDLLHISDLNVAAGIEILNPPDTVIATVGIVKEEPVAETAVEGEAAEPEVIGKGKKDDEEGGAEGGKKE